MHRIFALLLVLSLLGCSESSPDLGLPPAAPASGGMGGAAGDGGASGSPSQPDPDPDPEPPVHVLFLGGQSNVIAQDGTAPHAGFPDATIPLIAHSLGPGAEYEFDTGPDPVPLDLVNGFHSLELTAAPAMQGHGWRVAVVKVARGSSWLGEWRPGAPPDYWAAVTEARERAVSAWGANLVWHFVWLQSESDAQQLSRAEAYAENLRGFVFEVRELFGPIDFWQCKLQPSLGNGSGTGPIIRDAQSQVMGESPLNHLLDFDDLNGKLHYSSAQLDEMGERAAGALLQHSDDGS